jgi:glutamate formiminotransferase / 5-formyltetrahydrofolate cyclo-ligase
VFECVINISEGRRLDVLDSLRDASGSSFRDRHSDVTHHRSVFTLINEAPTLARDVRALITAAYQQLSLERHQGVHPRFGVVDVVPFVALDQARVTEAVTLRDETAQWICDTYAVPCFYYGPVNGVLRTLPEVRRHAFIDLAPDVGPLEANPQWGAVAVGQRPVMLAWNLWLDGVSLEEARRIVLAIRRPAVRALAFDLGASVQVSCNLIDVQNARPSEVYDQVSRALSPRGKISRAELVGLAPASLLASEDPNRWAELGLSPAATIEARLR